MIRKFQTFNFEAQTKYSGPGYIQSLTGIFVSGYDKMLTKLTFKHNFYVDIFTKTIHIYFYENGWKV